VAPSNSIATYIADVAEEWGERGTVDRNQAHAQALYTQSGLPEASFLQVLDIVRTLSRSARVTADSSRMSTFLHILREQIGLPESPNSADETSSTHPIPHPEQGL
jgi:hypothetical protein